MPRFLSWIVNKLRFKRFALSGRIKRLEQFSFCQGTYTNWKHDPRPLIFIMYSGDQYTHGLNCNYMNRSDKAWFGRSLVLMKQSSSAIDGVSMYRFLKMRRPSIIRDCYRVYFTALLDMKMVGAGLTPLDKLVYPITRDPWLIALNEQMKPSELAGGPSQIAFSPNELRQRINEAYNSVSLTQQRVSPSGPAAPYIGPAPWAKP